MVSSRTSSLTEAHGGARRRTEAHGGARSACAGSPRHTGSFQGSGSLMGAANVLVSAKRLYPTLIDFDPVQLGRAYRAVRSVWRLIPAVRSAARILGRRRPRLRVLTSSPNAIPMTRRPSMPRTTRTRCRVISHCVKATAEKRLHFARLSARHPEPRELSIRAQRHVARQQLTERGEREVVAQFLQACAKLSSPESMYAAGCRNTEGNQP
jgi:hypothetical protein